MIIQIYQDDDEWAVWLEPEEGDKHLGICAGVGDTREAALQDAQQGLEESMMQVAACLKEKS